MGEVVFEHLIFNCPDVLLEQERTLRDEFGLPIGLWKGYGYRPAEIDFEKFDSELLRLKARYPQAVFSIDLKGPGELKRYYRGPRRTQGPTFCAAPWTQVNLLANGELWVCPDVILGNIQANTFPEIWEGSRARALRRRLTRRLFPACRGCFYFYGDNARTDLEFSHA